MTYSPRARYSPIVVPGLWTPLTSGNIYEYSNFYENYTSFMPVYFWDIQPPIEQLACIFYSEILDMSEAYARMAIWSLDEERLYRPHTLLAQSDIVSFDNDYERGDAVIFDLLDTNGDPINSLQLETNTCAISIHTKGNNSSYGVQTFDYGGMPQFVTGHPDNNPTEVTYYGGPYNYSGGNYLGNNASLIDGGYDPDDLLPLQLPDGDDSDFWWNDFYWQEYCSAVLIKGAPNE